MGRKPKIETRELAAQAPGERTFVLPERARSALRYHRRADEPAALPGEDWISATPAALSLAGVKIQFGGSAGTSSSRGGLATFLCPSAGGGGGITSGSGGGGMNFPGAGFLESGASWQLVGGFLPSKFAEGAAMVHPLSSTKRKATVWSGMRIPIVSPSRAGTNTVKGPGHYLSITLYKFGCVYVE